MHICIIGGGASGWIACNYLKHLDFVKKITIIASSEIPSIGVGESNTLAFIDFLNFMIKEKEFTINDFLVETDASVKYGVLYKNWSKNNFLHHFKNYKHFNYSLINEDKDFFYFYMNLLGNKKESVNINDLIGGNIYNNVIKNFVLLDQENPISWHFDAGKFINFFSKIAQKNNKVNFIDSKILNGCIYDDEIKYINDKDKKIVADYYIFATGDQKINVDFLNINYKDMSNILLTDTALAFPLKYKNKKQELHPYTVAKTMNNGWRWITPTWSRIGTGYVFSSKHIDPEKAKKEFVEDVGIKKIEPFLVDFTPKINEKPMKKNWCTIGMASGFLEPLDAPGLSITIDQVMDKIPKYLKFINDNKNLHQQEYFLEQLNNYLFKIYKFWCCFILTQYKTCYRKDTKFWKDQKNVFWEEYDTIIDTIRNSGQFPGWAGMINHTVAAKDVGWKTFSELKPYQILEKTGDLINHMEYIVKIRNKEF